MQWLDSVAVRAANYGHLGSYFQSMAVRRTIVYIYCIIEKSFGRNGEVQPQMCLKPDMKKNHLPRCCLRFKFCNYSLSMPTVQTNRVQ